MALNYFYNAQLNESPEEVQTTSGSYSQWLWPILLAFLFLTHRDLNTCRNGDYTTHLILIVLILFFFTKSTG